MAFHSLRTRTKNKNKNDGKKQKKGAAVADVFSV